MVEVIERVWNHPVVSGSIVSLNAFSENADIQIRKAVRSSEEENWEMVANHNILWTQEAIVEALMGNYHVAKPGAPVDIWG